MALLYKCRRIEVVITGRTRNALAFNRARGFESHRLRQYAESVTEGQCSLHFFTNRIRTHLGEDEHELRNSIFTDTVPLFLLIQRQFN